MASYLRKTASALLTAKEYVGQWSSERVFADEPLIVPFPILAVFDNQTQAWQIQIKAWLYLPFQNKSLSDFIPPLTNSRSSDGNSKIAKKTSSQTNQLTITAVRTNNSMEIIKQTEENQILDDALGRKKASKTFY